MNNTFSSYNRKFFGGLIFLLLFTLVANILVDPLSINNFWLKDGVNKVKPKVHRYARIAKPIHIQNNQPDALILGSSRTEFGMRPSLINKISKYENTFNGAVSAGSLHDIEKFYFHAQASIPAIQEVLIGVDFFAFNALNGKPYQFPRILAATSAEEKNTMYKLNQWLLGYLSFEMLRASLSTLRAQESGSSRIHKDGSRDNRIRIDKFINRQGLYQTFIRTEYTYASQAWTSCANETYVYQNSKTGFDTFATLRRILDHANKNNKKIKLFMAPSHSRLWMALYEIGLWPQYEQWQRDISKVVADYDNVELWSFSNFNEFTNEELPKDGDREYEMSWHIDSSHYRAELGDLAIKSMYDAPDKIEGFGLQLSPDNIDQHIEDLRRGRDAFKNERPEEYAALLENVSQAVDLRHKYGAVCI